MRVERKRAARAALGLCAVLAMACRVPAQVHEPREYPELKIASRSLELSVVDGERTLTLGDRTSTDALPALDALAGEHDAVAIQAERVDGDLYAVDVFPL